LLKKVACAVGSSPLCSQYTSRGSLPGPFPNNPGSAPDEPKQTVRDFGKNCLQKLLAVRNFLFCNLATLSEMLAHVPEKSGGWNTFGDNVIRTNVFFFFCFFGTLQLVGYGVPGQSVGWLIIPVSLFVLCRSG